MADASAPASTEVLRLAGVRKSFGVGTPREVEVLHGVDLVLQRGEFCALIGPSGSGKSTMLNLIGLLDRPTAGTLFIEGQDTRTLDDAALTRLRGRNIGFVFQHHHLIGAFTAAENVMMPLLLDRRRPDAAMRRIAEGLLDRVGLLPWKDSRVGNLSGGQQQRVAIARALAMYPPLVLADEPTGNLDTKSADGVFDLLREMNQTSRTTFLIVTHDPRLAQRCDRIIEVVDGRIVADGAVPAPRRIAAS
ncbi:ABC transporter ATP-binding protein [Roseomonas rosulenta]|uniref:ABC transporter ATP-binding protein n=1 Tax=Roseomonas rosulenta TaxID=2748667 RepID=UPI0018DF98D9